MNIEIPGMTMIIPQGIDARGRVVGNVRLEEGYAYDGSPEGSFGFVREPNGMVTLFEVRLEGVLWNTTRGRGINDAGVIAGFVYDYDWQATGFVGTLPGLGGFQELTDVELIMVPFSDATGTYISDIDNRGRIAGGWTTEADPYKGYVATPVR